MRVREDDLQDALEAIDLEYYMEVEGIDFRVSYGGSGRQLQVKECPVCGNDANKVYLNAETGLGNCFAGSHPEGENFNKFRFISAIEGIRGPELIRTIKRIAKECGYIANRERPQVTVSADFQMIESIELPWLGQSLQYLYDRGIDNEAAAYFGLRWCESAWWTYKIGEEDQWQKWENRVVIPVADIDGVVRTFQGRDVTGSQKPKYLFAKGLPSTGQYLYRAHEAIGCETIVLAEGVFDVMAIELAIQSEKGWQSVGAVGSFGISLSETPGGQFDQLRALRDAGMKDLVIMWDNEPAAIRKAIDLALHLRRYGIHTRWAKLTLSLIHI